MKKINLFACAALVAGLLVSCSSEAGVKDYNNTTTTTTEYEYLVTGSYEVVTEESYKSFNYKNEQNDGNSEKVTKTYTIESTPAYVHFGTDENFSGNYESYSLSVNGSDGYYTKVVNSKTYWNGSKEKDYTASELKDLEVKKTDDPITDLNDSIWVSLYKIDGEFKVAANGALFDATVDEDALANGESFTLTYTIVSDDSSSDSAYTDYDANGKEITTAGSFSSTSKSTSKTTKTYTLKFAAK